AARLIRLLSSPILNRAAVPAQCPVACLDRLSFSSGFPETAPVMREPFHQLTLPSQRMIDNCRKIIVARTPTEGIAYSHATGHNPRPIAFPRWRIFHLEIHSRPALDHRHDLVNRKAVAVAAIERQRNSAGTQITQCERMSTGEIADVDVVTDACTVGCRIIAAKNLKLGPQSKRRFGGHLDQMRSGRGGVCPASPRR